MTDHGKNESEDSPPDFYEPLAKALPVAEQVQGLVLRRARTGILHTLKARGARKILDVCCGSGCLSCRLTMAGFDVTGLDSSPAMLKRATAKHRATRFLRCDASRIPFSETFDAAIVSLALHEMDAPRRDSVWAAMRRVVTPGGLLIALDFTIPKRVKWYTRAMAWLIDKDEKAIGGFNPAHYTNFREFMRSGGLEAWLETREQNEVTARYYGGGNIGVFTVAT